MSKKKNMQQQQQLEEEQEEITSSASRLTYPKVDIDILFNMGDTTQGIFNWLSKNIFIRQNYEDDTNLRMCPVSACYGNDASSTGYQSLKQVCSRFKVPFDSEYQCSDKYDGLLLKAIMSSFVLDKLFQSNIHGQMTYDTPNR